MKKLISIALVVLASFALGIFVGARFLSNTVKSSAVYEQAAVNVVNALQDEQMLNEMAAFAKESKGNVKRFLFAIVKNTSFSEKELADMQACIADYQGLSDLFDGVDIALVQEAWQKTAWEIIDGKIAVNPASLNSSARKLAGQDAVIAPRLKKIAALNAQWSGFIGNSIDAIDAVISERQSALVVPYINASTGMYKTLKKYPRLQELLYQVHACVQWPHTQQLFILALKDELINRMPEWLPKAWPYAKAGINELSEVSSGLLAKHSKYIAKHAADRRAPEAQDLQAEDSQE